MMRIDPDEVFAKVEEDRKSGVLSEKVTTAKIRYYASRRKGYLEQVNTETGERRLGAFSNGDFKPLDEDA
ncbi:MAG: hypothetical protein OQK94_00975 [Gammaproteobacteria bacterium]|nr:hypothetical protein [Gammaproteobacteria bacterium]MCW8839873.1 hypothetical protein [Gammaproteobacteria bacterium]MCW8958915.1 hypothetical protein [Gammaproteobacteria bacterium]MCW8992411.1 hypothetical protein [Gammaproteobacteria bacterium]